MSAAALSGSVSEAIAADPIAKAILASREAFISVPLELLPEFIQLVCDYAAQHSEKEIDCCRIVEMGVLQRGIQSMQEELSANKAFGDRVGWPKERV